MRRSDYIQALRGLTRKLNVRKISGRVMLTTFAGGGLGGRSGAPAINYGALQGNLALALGANGGIVNSGTQIQTFTMPNLASYFVQGTAATLSLRQYYSSIFPSGHVVTNITFSGTLPSGVTIDVANEQLVYNGVGALFTPANPGQYGYFEITTSPTQAVLALADWNSRTSAAGVLWATRFQSQSDVDKWCGHGSQPNPTYLNYQANRGVIPGDGCLRQFMPAGAGTPSGGFIWGRPIQPISGDINQPGVPALPAGSGAAYLTNYWNNGGVGYILHPDYAGSHGTPARTAPSVVGNEIYLQFRIRFSANRFTQGSYSKVVMFETNYTSGMNELVLHEYSPGSVLNRIPIFYTSKGSSWNTGLSNPQESGGGGVTSQREPGYANVCTYNNPGACWLWPADQWVTVLIHWKPGHQYISQTLSNGAVDLVANAPAADTWLRCWVALPGATQWTLIHDKRDYVWWFEEGATDSVGGHLAAYGLNWINFNYFTGGPAWVTQTNDWYHEFDQVICSLQPIALPAV